MVVLKYMAKEKARKIKALNNHSDFKFPLFVEKDEDGFYVVECPLLEGCYSQGKTIDKALKNIREVISLILEEKRSREIFRYYRPRELSLHTITL